MQDDPTMTLHEWLERHNMAQAELARRIGVSEATLSRIRRGVNTPGLDTAIKIQEATCNAVTLQDLIKSGGGVTRQ